MLKAKFNKEKYLEHAKSQGISSAITLLQKDIIEWEHEAFEGEKGYNPEAWAELHSIRNFSRELWELSLRTEGGPPPARP
jgi:hypothetical protein